MNKRGIGSVVGVVLIVLISIIAVSIFIGAYLKSVKKSTSDDSASCLGIDLEAKVCAVYDDIINALPGFPPSLHLAPNEKATRLNIERHPGKGEIKGIVIIIEDSAGNKYAKETIDLTIGNLFSASANYSNFNEYDSVDVVSRGFYDVVEVKSATVAAIVGDSRTICSPVRAPVNCVRSLYGSTP